MAGGNTEAEEKMLRRLRQALARPWRFGKSSFKLEPFGSYVTQLGIGDSREEQGRSDLDVVMLFRGSAADTFTHREVRDGLVLPTISTLGRLLPSLHGIVVKNVIEHARVPIVKFESKELSVDISVQQPWGVLNSWHLRDLCNSGPPDRLRSLVRMVKTWARSKGINAARDGSLNSYGYCMLAASFLQERRVLPFLLPRAARAGGNRYMDADEALKHVMASSSGVGCWDFPAKDWSPPERFEPDDFALFRDWLGWMATTVLGFADACRDAPGGVGTVPLEHRHVVSVRRRTQEQLRADVTWSPMVNEHWEPGTREVYMLIEEPLNGENVARCVRAEGFWAIRAEVDRARRDLASARGRRAGSVAFQAVLDLPPLSHARRPQLPKSVGLWSRRLQRPTGGNAERPPVKAAGEAEAQAILELCLRSPESSRRAQAMLGGGEECQRKLAQAICGSVVRLSKDKNGNFVVQEAVKLLNAEGVASITGEILLADWQSVVCDRKGLRVIQRLIEKYRGYTEEGPDLLHSPLVRRAIECIRELLDRLCTNRQRIRELCEDRWGHFVLEHLLEFGPRELKSAVALALLGDLEGIATHEFGSRVLQKAMICCDERATVCQGLAECAGALQGNMYAKKLLQLL